MIYIREATIIPSIDLKDDGIIQGREYTGLMTASGAVDIETEYGIVKLVSGEYTEIQMRTK